MSGEEFDKTPVFIALGAIGIFLIFGLIAFAALKKFRTNAPVAAPARVKLAPAQVTELGKKYASFTQRALKLTSAAGPESAIPAGASKLGGLPDVPADFDWPKWKGKPLAFIAQIDLAEAGAQMESVLPATGLLSFFYDAEQSTWGFDPKDAGSWRVFLFEKDRLRRASAPKGLDPKTIYKASRLALKQSNSFPEPGSLAAVQAGIPKDDVAYQSFYEALQENDPPGHQLLGFAAPIQNEMELDCQLVSNGLYCGDGTGYKHVRAKELEPGATDWRLLLQVDSDDNSNMMWGDAGRIYFWIRKQDLEKKDFSKGWFHLQCY